MNAESSSFRARRGFTLIEVLVSIVVLFIIIVIVGQVIEMTTKVITTTSKKQDADGQARLTLDRMGADLTNLVRRTDLDLIFSKQTGNDKLFFYSEAPAYFDPTNTTFFPGSSSSDPKGILSLIGYRVNSSFQLERLGMGLTWDGVSSTTTPGSVVYLSYLNGVLDPASTLAGNWPGAIGSAPTYIGTDTTYWQVLATQVFRMEICYLLKDGTLSLLPVTSPTSSANNLTAVVAPQVTNDSTAGYSIGSRWFDVSAQRGYICADNTAGAAVWNAIGTKDLGAVVVAIAVLDDNSRKLVTTSLTGAAGLLPDVTAADLSATPPRLMKSTWQAVIQTPTFATSAGIPPQAASHVRVYQRYFYLNAP